MTTDSKFTEMDFKAKLSAFNSEMKRHGELIINIHPPVCLLLWKLGFQFTPPIFWPLPTLLIVSSLFFALLCSASFVVIITLLADSYPVIANFIDSKHDVFTKSLLIFTAGGVAIGLATSLSLYRKKRRYRLTNWKYYSTP